MPETAWKGLGARKPGPLGNMSPARCPQYGPPQKSLASCPSSNAK